MMLSCQGQDVADWLAGLPLLHVNAASSRAEATPQPQQLAC